MLLHLVAIRKTLLTSLSMKDKSCSSIVEERPALTLTLSRVGARNVGGGGGGISKLPSAIIRQLHLPSASAVGSPCRKKKRIKLLPA
ncbi:hypothetical protein Esi_0062_0091 [Ectocarpus siliculosus]|uniref:Uncharacterized protein n=1 Tax=Ectocarpus siliculosus TaxID=2880 RepID=D8LR54_ECTSI|nr:hypothetical protein Esi_0062_0091 [Ectocarpus siliculosus]|eukprot:CBN77727.1 hypothetical protein Esi_0062_0091 [Ectocarpus siliculosus]